MNSPRNHPQTNTQYLRRRILAWVSALALITLTSCSGGSGGGGTETPTANSAVIGAAGGTLNGPDGTQVIVPAGALDHPTTISIARSSVGAPATLPEDSTAAGGIYEFTPHDVVFHRPVTIRMPVPANAVGSEVFMAGLGADWQLNDATVVNGFAEWERNSFSFGMVPFCAPAANDLYPCVYPKGYATAGATHPTDITRRTSGYPGLNAGSAGSWVVNAASTVTLTLNYQAAPDCIVSGPDAARAKLLRWNPDAPLNTPARGLQTLFDGPVGLTLTTFPVFGGGSYQRLAGSTTVDVSSSLTDATNAFGFTFSCKRPSKSRSTGGDLITIIGPMPSPPVSPHTISGTVTGLTGSGLVLQNNNGDNLTVPASASSFIFATPIT
jgi:hypothetical protein